MSCPICGSASFQPGPNGRLSRRRLPPVCNGCGSLERHRIGRTVMDALRDREKFRSYRLLMLGTERIVAKGWFKAVDISVFGTPDAVDLHAITRPDSSYDVIICSHLLARVQDHRKALKELMRVLSNDGILFLSYPNPVTRATSVDWGYADHTQHGHFRVFGRDFEEEYAKIVPNTFVMAVRGVDPVTGDDDLVYLLTRNFFWARRAASAGLDMRLL